MDFDKFFEDWHLLFDWQRLCLRMPLCNRDTPQIDVQQWLNGIEAQHGLDTAFAALFRWELESGYWSQGIFDANLRLKFAPQGGSPVEFRTQINYSRLNYSAPPVAEKAEAAKPHCPICFSDNVATAAKPLLRAYEFALGGELPTPYFVQATPFPLVRGHFIVIQTAHEPMRIERRTLDELLDFVERAPTFTACSNSDVLNAGVSIIGHHHYQVFSRRWDLPVMQASAMDECAALLCGDKVAACMLDYPLATVRLVAAQSARADLLNVAAQFVERWKSDAPDANTCNVVVRLTMDGNYEIHLFLRNPNYLTPPDLLHIKSEGVGVVEAAGEGIYPPPPDETLDEVRHNGRAILMHILGGLNPVAPTDRPAVFQRLLT